jgi:hypothetical protein
MTGLSPTPMPFAAKKPIWSREKGSSPKAET